MVQKRKPIFSSLLVKQKRKIKWQPEKSSSEEGDFMGDQSLCIGKERAREDAEYEEEGRFSSVVWAQWREDSFCRELKEKKSN